PNAGHHYLTTSNSDSDFLVTHGWIAEPDQGFMFPAAATGATEIFHLYNINNGDHLFTESNSERVTVLAIPTIPAPWVQQTSLGFAFAASAMASAPPQQSGAHSVPSNDDPSVF